MVRVLIADAKLTIKCGVLEAGLPFFSALHVPGSILSVGHQPILNLFLVISYPLVGFNPMGAEELQSIHGLEGDVRGQPHAQSFASLSYDLVTPSLRSGGGQALSRLKLRCCEADTAHGSILSVGCLPILNLFLVISYPLVHVNRGLVYPRLRAGWRAGSAARPGVSLRRNSRCNLVTPTLRFGVGHGVSPNRRN